MIQSEIRDPITYASLLPLKNLVLLPSFSQGPSQQMSF